jgi:hypothetical protein
MNGGSMKKAVALLLPIGLAAALLAGYMWGHIEGSTGSRTFAAAQQTCGARKFYLTKTKVTGDGALKACTATGYHMASFYEIANLGGLQYDVTNGATGVDSGSGPPIQTTSGDGAYGWIRTGGPSWTNDLNFGWANCTAWTSGSADDTGTSVGLDSLWIAANDNVYRVHGAEIWRVEVGNTSQKLGIPACSVPRHVWCVQD